MKIFNGALIAIFIGMALAIGFFMGTMSNGSSNNLPVNAVSSSSSSGFLGDLLMYIDQEYVDTVSKEQLINSTVTHLLSELDPHSYYITPDEIAAMNEPLEGNFDGIGIQFNIQHDTIMVIDPLVGGPSQKLGIKAGDRIVKVNDSIIAGVGIRNSQVLKLLKGPKGTKVKIEVYRKNTEPLTFNITRAKIPIYSVSTAYMLNTEMGYVKVDRFGRTTFDEFATALNQLSTEGAKTFVIDLRDNGGGYMNAATQMLDLFFDKGELLVYTEGKARPREDLTAKGPAAFPNKRVVVLINEGSASASEIFAGAIQDHDRGIVVGRRSFGKGLVQEQTMWPNGAATRLTIARYFTPSGRCIQKPYEDGEKAYNEDYYHRYESGEMISKDSISVNDSAAFFTDNGRKVYGSGGIIPDVFVPIDTTHGSYLLNQLVYGGIIYDFAFEYTDAHRKELSQYGNVWQFMDDFKVSNSMFEALIELGKKEGMVVTNRDINRSKGLILKRIKAYIGRNMWQDEGFYPIWNADDPTINAAMVAQDEILN